MKHIVIAAALLSLAACGGGGEEGGNSSSEEETTPATVQEPTPENLTDDPGNSVQPMTPINPPQSGQAPAASPTPVAGGRIPASFQGRWGMTETDCVPGRADNKGLMIVSTNGLRFYESRGAVERAAVVRPGALELDLAFTGEGQQWNRTETLTLLGGGRTLVREEQRPAASYRYIKCPAGRETAA